jgi:hypothetical protein
MAGVPGESIPAPIPEAERGQHFARRLPYTEQIMGDLLQTDQASWRPAGDAHDGVIGTVHARATLGTAAGIITVTQWLGRHPETQEVEAQYMLGMQGGKTTVAWHNGAKAPGDIQFAHPTHPARRQRPDFGLALDLANMLPNAVPMDLAELRLQPVAAMRRWLDWWDGEMQQVLREGKWPFHPLF